LNLNLKEQRYIVAKARTQCSNSKGDHENNFRNFIELTPPDHEFTSLMCDPNYQES